MGATRVRADGSVRPPLWAGQIGVRHSHASGKMKAMRTLTADYRVVGVAETHAESRARAEGQSPYEGLRWMEEKELLGIPEVKVVAVETGIDDLTATARRCLAAGKHIHLDKPGGQDHAVFRAMRLEAEAAGLTVQMGYMLRYNPAFELLFRAAREGWLGEILEIDASMGKLADPGLRRELAVFPGGGMFELACHVVDAVVTLLGKPMAVTPFVRRVGTEGAAFPDHQLAVLEYAKALVTVRCNHMDPHGNPRRRFHVTGTQGTMAIEPLESGKVRLMLDRPAGGFAKGVHDRVLPIPGGRYDGEFADLSRVVRGEKPFAWNAAHDIAVHETVLKAAGMMWH